MCCEVQKEYASCNDSSKFWGLKGGATLGCRNFRDAVNYCAKAIALDESNLQAQFFIGSALFNLQQFLEAVDHLTIVIQAHPLHIQSHFLRIECKRSCGLWNEIIVDAKAMLKLFKAKKVETQEVDKNSGTVKGLCIDNVTHKKNSNAVTPQATVSTIYTSLAESLLHLGLLRKAEVTAGRAILYNNKNQRT